MKVIRLLFLLLYLLFVPAWNEEDTLDETFNDAVDYCIIVLKRIIKKYAATVAARSMVKQSMENSNTHKTGILILGKYIPWISTACTEENCKFCIFPGIRGGYNVQAVPVQAGSRENRIPFPDDWRGLQGMEADIKCPGMTFCHQAGFLAAFNTLEEAIGAAKALIDNT